MQDKEMGIGDFVIEAYSEYGDYINKFRHIPKLEDGLKPVYKRVILGALEIASNKKIKTATLSGYVCGPLHPHGSASINGVIAELVRAGI